MNDDELVKRIRQGDEAAAEELIKRYYASILRYCAKHCCDRQTAEDITQETFIKLFRGLPGYTERGRLKAYLYTIANRLCINESSRRVPVYPLEEDLADGHNDILQMHDRAEVDYLLGVLPPKQKEAVILRFGEDLSYQEIAGVMGCSMRTAQSRVRNALKRMRRERENEE